MPNYIQYSTQIPSGSLKKGNAALGITDSVAGPTSNTGWYTGINPPTGSYTVYEVAASGDPDIYCPINSTELINLVQSKGATGGNTGSVAAALAWIATQNNLLATNEVYPNIVTSGSAMILDAGFVGSYPTTASTWYDVSGFGNNGTLVNGPTFNNAGYITFDGIDDVASFTANTFNSGSPQQGTFSALIKFPTLNTSSQTILFNDGGNFGSNAISLYRNSNFSTNQYSWLIYSTGSTGQGFYLQGTTYLPGRWYDTTFTFANTGTGSIYRNGELINSSATVGGGNFISWRRTGNNQPIITPASSTGTGSIQSFKWYNRPLTQTEILQNYYQAPIVTNGLIFAVDAGNLVSYESGSTTTYSLTGSISGSLVNGTGYSNVNGGSWVFDGVDDYINFTYSSNVAFLNRDPYTLEAFVQAQSSPSYPGIINRESTVGGFRDGYNLIYTEEGITSGNVFVFSERFASGSQLGVGLQIPTSSFFNNWHQIVSTYDGTTLSFYYDGVFIRDGSSTGNITNTSKALEIAARNGNELKGNLSISRIYNRALTAAEVQQNFNAQKGRFGL